MERLIVLSCMESALSNALASNRHYEGMSAPDGSDISSRTKHREFMKRTGLTTADDFKGTWDKAHQDRQQYRAGQRDDKSIKQAIERQLYRRS